MVPSGNDDRTAPLWFDALPTGSKTVSCFWFDGLFVPFGATSGRNGRRPKPSAIELRRAEIVDRRDLRPGVGSTETSVSVQTPGDSVRLEAYRPARLHLPGR